MPLDDRLRLDNQLCFALYACSREMIKLYRPILDQLGLTYTQYVTLLALWEQDGVTVKELGARLHLDSGTLTPLLKKLETMGCVTRTRGQADERSVLIRLTEKGAALKAEACDVPGQLLGKAGMPEGEVTELREQMQALLSRIEQMRAVD